MSGRIPEGYTLLEQRFWRRVVDAQRVWQPESSTGVELREWEREGWTYHAKGQSDRLCYKLFVFNTKQGIWITPAVGGLPSVTVFGSTNLNSRSANLDTELSFIMESRSDALQRGLAAEVAGLRECSRVVGEESWRDPSRRVRWGTKAIVAVVGGML